MPISCFDGCVKILKLLFCCLQNLKLLCIMFTDLDSVILEFKELANLVFWYLQNFKLVLVVFTDLETVVLMFYRS